MCIVEKAIQALKDGELIIIADDEHRENEGDFVYAAEFSTADKVNFLIKEGRGLVCTPILEEHAKKLELKPMVAKNTTPCNTAFTVSIDLIEGITTGISTTDRSKTIQALANSNSTADSFHRPGHMFPLIAVKGGILERRGQTEASINLLQLADLTPVSVICEITNDDGSMARRTELLEIAKKYNMIFVTIQDIVEYVKKNSLENKITC